jgi:SAM-dependent methyltransferase
MATITIDRRVSTLDLVEGFHLAHAVAALHELGVIRSLEAPSTAHEISHRHQLAVNLLEPTLDLVSARTDLVDKRGVKFVATECYDAHARFRLDQYLLVYGANARGLVDLLRDPTGAPDLVDRPRHARAWAEYGQPGFGLLIDLISQLELNHVLDVGCGPGSMLLALACRHPEFVGWGIDVNPDMVAIARHRLGAAGVVDRVQVVEGDVENLQAAVPASGRGSVRAISAMSLLNEFFATGDERAVTWLRRLREVFPERALLVADYYGRLGRSDPPWPRQTALHDFVQLISGQGVPPADRSHWADIYDAADCTLIHVIEDEAMTGFVHILRT